MRKRYITTIITALALVAYLALDDHQAEVAMVAQDLQAQEPDYIIKGVRANIFDDSGELAQTISASKAIHYPKNDMTALTAPSVLVYDKGLEKWRISSDTGRLYQQQTIELIGQVRVESANDEEALRLDTERLDIDLVAQIADTDKPVIINRVGSELLATGMTILLDKQWVEFKSNVRGRHDPKTQP